MRFLISAWIAGQLFSLFLGEPYKSWDLIISCAVCFTGYLYWQQIGCASGICMITSKPLNSTIYGAAMGGLFFGMFKKRSNKNENKSTL
jgi:hypothetical protein